jgi:hypothetical protein
MKLIFEISILVLMNGSAFSQSAEKYVKSFERIENGAVLSFAKIIQKGRTMTKHEALQFVYRGDTTKLTCSFDQYDLATEKFVRTIRSENLPVKCARIDMKDYYMIAYSCHVCDPKKPEMIYLMLSIYSKAYQLMDALVVYREKYDFPEILGEVNTTNGNFLLTGYLKTESVNPSDTKVKAYASLLTVDSKSLKFKALKEAVAINGDYTNLSKILKNLNWESLFLQQ